MTTKYSFKTRIISIKEHFSPQNWRLEFDGEKKLTTYDSVSDGWYIVLHGSMESIYIGNVKPDLIEGQRVTVTITPDEG